MDGNYNNYQDNTANNVYYQPPVNNGDGKANGKQVASLVFGIMAICFSCCYGVPGIIFGVVGIILAAVGNKENKSGIGTAGLVCSIIGLVCGILMTIYYAVIIMVVLESMGSGGEYSELLEKPLEMMDQY